MVTTPPREPAVRSINAAWNRYLQCRNHVIREVMAQQQQQQQQQQQHRNAPSFFTMMDLDAFIRSADAIYNHSSRADDAARGSNNEGGLASVCPRSGSITSDSEIELALRLTREAAAAAAGAKITSDPLAVKNSSNSYSSSSARVSDGDYAGGSFARFRKDDMHFMCTFDPKMPAAPIQARVDRDGCHDRVNAVFAEGLLAALLLMQEPKL